jgi:hypothetical protein
MMNKSIMASLFALLAWTASACAQGGLGVPVPHENPADAAACPDCKARPYRPILNYLTRSRLPARTTSSALLPPAPQPDGPTRDDVARMVNDGGFSPAEITAAKIKMDEIQAKERQAAVKYLATVDCHYYPEAEMSLIAALRADRSEGVRLEAAQALGSCRGVTVRILDALHLTATAQETDGNPMETSERVRLAARASLNRLLSSGMGTSDAEGAPVPPRPALPTLPAAPVQPAGYNPPIQGPASPPASQQERDIAATVGVPPRSAAPTPARPTLYSFWLNLMSGRDVASSQRAVDPRLRGMTPLGSEVLLAIPTVHSHPVASTSSPYND